MKLPRLCSPTAVLLLSLRWASAEPTAAGISAEPPTSWIDPDTGHRVIRLTREPGSDSFYFNFNGYTPDGEEMAYTTPEGISVLNLKTQAARQVVKGPARAIIVGPHTPTLYYTTKPAGSPVNQLWAVNLKNGQSRKLADLPKRASVGTINADETLAAGTFIEGDANAGGAYDGTAATGRIGDKNLVFRSNMLGPDYAFAVEVAKAETK